MSERAKGHRLKTWPAPFLAVRLGEKTHEFRKDDRGFATGDTLVLEEWDPQTGRYTGQQEHRRVTYISRGPQFGIPEGYCVMSLEPPCRRCLSSVARLCAMCVGEVAGAAAGATAAAKGAQP